MGFRNSIGDKMQLVATAAKFLKCFCSTVVTLPKVGQSLLESGFAVFDKLSKIFGRPLSYTHFAK